MIALRSFQACCIASSVVTSKPGSAMVRAARYRIEGRRRRGTWLSMARTQSTTANPHFLSDDTSRESSPGASEHWTDADSSRRKEEMLELSLQQVHEHGWTRRALVEAAAKLLDQSRGSHGNLPSLSISGLFAPEELVHTLMQRWNDRLRTDLERAARENPLALATPQQRAAYAIQTRLCYMTDYVESKRWSSAMAMGAHPAHLFTTQQRLREMMDVIAGFVATDPSSPTSSSALSEIQKALLGAVYVATELHLLTDAPPFHDTWDFLEQRVEEWDRLLGASSSGSTWESSMTPSDTLAVAWTVSTAVASGVYSVIVPPSSSSHPLLSGVALPQPPRTLPTLPVLGAPPQPLADLWSLVFGSDDDDDKARVSARSPSLGTDPSHYAAPSERGSGKKPRA